MNPLIQFPAHLITGPTQTAEQQVLTWLQEIFSKDHTCQECSRCQAIINKNFYGFSWFTPDNKYTIETIEPIFHKISFELGPEEHYFFILSRAELLTPACANMLLKVVEEPPHGYHFIFIAPHKNAVLPTIVSRCVEYTCHENHSTFAPRSSLLQQALMNHHDWTTVYKEIAGYDLNEHESLALFEKLLNELTHLYTKKMMNSDTVNFSFSTIERLSQACKKILEQPMQPGNAKLIWKDFFMYKTLITTDN